MKKILQNFLTKLKKSDPPRRGRKLKSRGQSLVEVAIAFPLLIMLFSGMVEFGFMLNTYLSLLDATRQVAREYANEQPFVLDESVDPPVVSDNWDFYNGATLRIIDTLAPNNDAQARSIVFDPATDDIVISVLSVHVSDSTDTITAIDRFPETLPNPYFQAFNNQLSNYEDNASIEALMTDNATLPVRTGILIIEIFYNYEGVLKLPWVEGFLGMVPLHADTVMPLVTAKPLRTP